MMEVEGKTEKAKAKNSFLLLASMAAQLDVTDIVSILSSEGVDYFLSAQQKVPCPCSSMTLHLSPLTFVNYSKHIRSDFSYSSAQIIIPPTRTYYLSSHPRNCR